MAGAWGIRKLRWRLLKLDFPYLLGELVIVVLGVVIALAANGWFEDWREQQTERRYLDRISRDLNAGHVGLTAFLERNALSRSATARLLKLLCVKEPDQGDLLENFLYAAQTGGTTAELRHDVTFNELVSTGTFDTVSDPELRAGIAAYYRLVDDFFEIAEGTPRLEALGLFLSLTGFIPEEYTYRGRAFSEADKPRILGELGRNSALAKQLRVQHALQGLLASNGSRLIEANGEVVERIAAARQ